MNERVDGSARDADLTVEKPYFRPDLEGMRAIAVTVVLGFHSGMPGFSGGFVGVDVFFVISGYLITWLLLSEASLEGRVDLAAFYARRARRLLPAMFLVTGVVALVSIVLYAPLEQRFVVNSAISSLVYASNLYFAYLSADYLHAPADVNPLLHTWSLSVEEQFYILWPLLMLVVARRWSSAGPTWARFVPVVVVGVVSFALCVWLTGLQQPQGFYLPVTRAWEFCVGAGCTLVLHAGSRRWRAPDALGLFLSVAGFLAIAAATRFYDEETLFPGVAAVLPVAGAAAMILGAGSGHGGAAGLLGSPMALAVGRLSYSLYLWHWPIFVFAALLGLTETLPERIACLALSVLLAAGSHRFLEGPVRDRKIVSSRKWLLVFGTTAGVLLACSLLWRQETLEWADQADQRRYTAARESVPDVYATGCHAAFDVVDLPALENCTMRGDRPGPRVLLFGDSHAAHWVPAFRDIIERVGGEILTLTKSACPAIDRIHRLEAFNRPYHECRRWREEIALLAHASRPDVIVMASASSYGFSEMAWAGGVRDMIEQVASDGAHVIVIGPTPRPLFDVPGCLARRSWAGSLSVGCRMPESDEQVEVAAAGHRAGASSLPEVTLLDGRSLVCPYGRCALERDGVVVFRDADHLTVDFVRTTVPELLEKLKHVLFEPVEPQARAWNGLGSAPRSQ